MSSVFQFDLFLSCNRNDRDFAAALEFDTATLLRELGDRAAPLQSAN